MVALTLVATLNASAAPRDGGGLFPGVAAGMKPLHLPAGVKRIADVPYGDDARQRFDVYQPESPAPQRAPVIVMVHGGAWMVGNKSLPQVVENKVARWVTRGAILVSINYRLVPQVAPLEQADDVARAIAAVQRLAPSWGGDPTRIALMGHSAGAHLVALVTASPSIAKNAGAQPWLGTIVLDSAAIDTVGLMQRRHARFYDRVFGADAALWRAASPTEVVTAAAPPMLLVCSTQRSDGSCGQAQAFAAQALARGARASVLEQDLSHIEVNATLGLPGTETDAVQAFFDTIGLGAH
ncbi:MAG: alpha/beta hydrolase [Burkholderiales bacterium]